MNSAPSGLSPRSGAIAALVLTSFLAGSCSPEPESKPRVAVRPPNFVLLLVDTLRTDRIASAGQAKAISPNFDALRSESTVFSNAYATSPWTLPSTVSLFLSQVPSQHGVTRWASLLGNEHTTLVEVLRGAGYRTGGFSANRLVTPERGFLQGFDTFEFVAHPKWKRGTPPHSQYVFATAEDITSKALAWLGAGRGAEGNAPFFLYLHIMEPHTPYLCPPAAGADCNATATRLNHRLTLTQWAFTDSERSLIQEFYDADVRRADATLGRLYDALGERGLLENTWLILTADHGEMLGEHDLWMHGHALYEETQRIPLLLRSPSRRSATVDAPVSLVDIAPTVLDLAGIQPPAPFEGRSLRPALEARPLRSRPIVSELFPVRDEPDRRQRHLLAVTRGATKLVVGIDGTLERFDLSNDPREEAPLPAEANEIEALLLEAGVAFRHFEALAETVPELSPGMLEDLKELGYVQE
jgi:arylsulfatase